MKETSPSQARRDPQGLRFTATQCHDGEANLFINSLVFREGEVMAILTVGIDQGKNVFAVNPSATALLPRANGARASADLQGCKQGSRKKNITTATWQNEKSH
jgi:hypothetical protein